jgi:phosphoribosylformylglycinamidine synthase
MWQFAETVRGLADGCAFLGTPVTGGNVSFYNQTGDVPVHPTPVVGVLGVLEDVRRRLPLSFSKPGASGQGPGDEVTGTFGPSGGSGPWGPGARPREGGVPPRASIVLLGTTRPEFGGSAWAWVVHGHLGGQPPALDLAAERALAGVLAAAAADGLLTAAHDLSDGGLAVALAECCLGGRTGCQVTLPGDPFIALFSESPARAVAEVAPGAEAAFAALCERHGVPLTELGTVGGGQLEVAGWFSVPVAELAEAHQRVMPALFG